MRTQRFGWPTLFLLAILRLPGETVNERRRPSGSHGRDIFIPLITLLFNVHSFAVHALKNARLHLFRRQTRP
jgi:hypothetical protein